MLKSAAESGADQTQPDGSRLAVTLWRQGPSAFYGIRVYDLPGGGYRTWILPPRQVTMGVGSPSWDPDSRHLAVLVGSTRCSRAAWSDCVQLLDTTTPGGNVMAASVTIFRTATVRRLVAWSTSLLTTNGSRVLVAGMAGRKLRKGEDYFYLPVVYDVSARSGQILSHLTGRRGENLWPVWSRPTARFFILTRPNGDAIGSISAAIYGAREQVQVRLPAQTISAAW